jgi:molybdopterin-guanine dinucleotide biosynthesis protein A
MGGMDKGLVKVAGVPMASWVVRSLRPQVSRILINANRNLDAYAELGFEVVSDASDDYLGPLAGIASGMAAAGTGYLVTAPCDSPLVVGDLVARLHEVAAATGADVVVAHDGERLQPVFALLRCQLLESLQSYLDGGGRKIDGWYRQHRMATADFSDCPENFLNINEPAERAQLEERLKDRGGDR